MASQITPQTIEGYLNDRLIQTNILWNEKDDSLEQEKLVVFLYFFDLSSAIESCFRNIVLEYSKCNINGSLLSGFSEPNNDGRPYFLDIKHIKNLFKNINISQIANLNDFEMFCKDQILFLKNTNISSIDYFFDDLTCLEGKYDAIKRQRNTMAHGLLAYVNGDFSQTKLCDFCYLYYLLISLYKSIFNTIN